MKNSLISLTLKDLLREIAQTTVDFVEYERPSLNLEKAALTLGTAVVETKKVAVETQCALLGQQALAELARMEPLCGEAAIFISKNMWRPITEIENIRTPNGLRILGKTATGTINIYYWDIQAYNRRPKPFWRNTNFGTTWSRENQPVFFKPLDGDDPSDALKNLLIWGLCDDH